MRLAWLLLAAASLAAQGPQPKDARVGILEAFESHRLVAIGEVHRNQQVHDFIVSVIRDARFAGVVNDIVVEFGNARFQAVVDRYTSGETVPQKDLQQAWRETVNILVWDAPVYERLFRTVREVNLRRAPNQRLRVVLTDPPIDWTQIQTREQWLKFADQRDAHAAKVIEVEVLRRGRRALLIFGSGHVMRDTPANLSGLIPNLFVVWFHSSGWGLDEIEPRLRPWPVPSMAAMRGTWLGSTHLGAGEGPKLEDIADSFLYLGPMRSLRESKPPLQLYRDPAYMRELARRDTIQGGYNRTELEDLNRRLRR